MKAPMPAGKSQPLTGDDWIACGAFLFVGTGILLGCLLVASAVEAFLMHKVLGPQPCVCVPAEGG